MLFVPTTVLTSDWPRSSEKNYKKVKIDTTFLRSKVAIRIFALFISCALAPIIVLTILSFFRVTSELRTQSFERLREINKSMEEGATQRLLVLETEMTVVATNLRQGSADSILSQDSIARLKEHFQSLVLITDNEGTLPIFGQVQNIPELTQNEKKDIFSKGKSFLSTEYHPDSPPSIFMGIGLDVGKQEILLAEVDIHYIILMGLDYNPLPPGIGLCLLNNEANMLYSTLTFPLSIPDQIAQEMKSGRSQSGNFEWSHQKSDYLSNYRQIFLQSNHVTRNSNYWMSVVSQAKAEVFEPIIDFRQIFILAVLLSLWVVLLLSYNQIRRTLVPLERLKEGTQRIARKEFSSRVMVKSRDEFGEVAESFNSMASQLARHFNTLTTVAEIDRAVLSVLDREKIVDTVLDRMREVFPCNAVGVTVFDSTSKDKAQTYVRDSELGQERLMDTVELKAQDVESLYNNPKTLALEASDVWPSYLLPLARRGNKSFLILPIFIKKELSGIVALGYLQPPSLTQDDLEQARQLADQVAVAFSNVRLIEDLDRLNWGTLRALARAIDAKSPWTAGHSERMTKLALQIGEKIGLSQEEIDDLHRGGLLHDIGKIGVPPEILDKAGKLTDEERQTMNRHAAAGARILEPIAAYAKVIPLVLQHHERFNGQGYPDGLAGEVISLGARIFGVADTFEALTSERPYRKALQHKIAAQYIKDRAGTDFDPKVVQAFIEVMADEGIKL